MIKKELISKDILKLARGIIKKKLLNRLLQNFGKAIIKNKLQFLKDEFGIKITEINPAYTSQTCSKCGYISKRNRKTQSVFICEFCNKK